MSLTHSVTARVIVIHSVVSILSGCGDGADSVVDPPPGPPVLTAVLGDTVEHVGPQPWQLTGVQGKEIIIFLQNHMDAQPWMDTLRVIQPVVPTDADLFAFERGADALEHLPALLSASRGAELESAATGRFYLLNEGPYTIGVQGRPDIAYRFWIYEIDRAPEAVPTRLTLGDTVSESIDHVGDIDRYTFTAIAGDQVNILLSARSGHPNTHISAELPNAVNIEGTIPVALATGVDTILGDRSSGRLEVTSSGVHELYVYGRSSKDVLDRGEYQIQLYPIATATEIHSGVIDVPDTVATETIAQPGDIDDFTLLVAESTEVNFVIVHASIDRFTYGLSITVYDDADLSAPTHVIAGQAFEFQEFTFGGFWVEPGTTYTVRISGIGMPGGYRGGYDFRTYSVDRSPEGRAAVLALADTVDEALDPIGDVDEYEFVGGAGEHRNVLFKDLEPDAGIWWTVSCPGDSLPYVDPQAAVVSSPLWDQETLRFTLPEDGVYRIKVSTTFYGKSFRARRPYRVLLEGIDGSPETVGSDVTAGVTISAEMIDFLGDVDEFVINGTPDSNVILLFQSEGSRLHLEILDSTGQPTHNTPSSGFEESLGMHVLPAGGLRVRVLQFPVSCDAAFVNQYSYVGGYTLRTVSISRGPETQSAAITIGQTVSGEVDPEGDIDEFTFTAPVDQTLTTYFQTPTVPSTPGLVLDVIDLATDQVLGTVSSLSPTENLEDRETGPFTVNQDGEYLVRVRGGSDRDGSGAYVFQVAAIP